MSRRDLRSKKNTNRDDQPALNQDDPANGARRGERSAGTREPRPGYRGAGSWGAAPAARNDDLDPIVVALSTPAADQAARDPDFELKDRLKNLLAFEEGRIVNSAGLHVAYRDSKGIATIGYGFNLEDGSAPGVLRQVTTTSTTTLIAKQAFLTEAEAQELLFIAEDVAVRGVRPFFPDYLKLDMPRRVVLAAMVYQMGADRFGKFRRLIPAVQQQDWPTVVQSMEQSQWYRGDSPKRARRMADAMQSGTFPPYAVMSDASKGPLIPHSRPAPGQGSAPPAPGPVPVPAPKPPLAETRRSPWPFDN